MVFLAWCHVEVEEASSVIHQLTPPSAHLLDLPERMPLPERRLVLSLYESLAEALTQAIRRLDRAGKPALHALGRLRARFLSKGAVTARPRQPGALRRRQQIMALVNAADKRLAVQIRKDRAALELTVGVVELVVVMFLLCRSANLIE